MELLLFIQASIILLFILNIDKSFPLSRKGMILKITFSKLKNSEIWKPTFTRLSVLVRQWDRVRYQVQQVMSGVFSFKHGLLALTPAWGWETQFHALSTSTSASIWCRVVKERSHCRANAWDTRPTKVVGSEMGLWAKPGHIIMYISEWTL